MGERTDNIITKQFTYAVTDEYLSQSNDLNKTATMEYEGPEKQYVFVDSETNILVHSPSYTLESDGDLIPVPAGHYRLEIDANENPMIAWIILGVVDANKIEYISETLPNGTIYKEPKDLLPNMVYETDEIVYNKDSGEFTIPWKEPHVDWDDIRNARNGLIKQTDTVLINSVLTDEERATLEAYRQELRDITDDFADFPPWKVGFPDAPKIGGLE